MSAYMCESPKLMALALALHREGLPIDEAGDVFTLFDRLRSKNMAAMDTRYPGRWNPAEEAEYPEDLAVVMREADALAVPLVDAPDGSRGLIAEYVYQASECEDWDHCPESLALAGLRVRLTEREKIERPAREAAAREDMAKACEAERARILAAFPYLETAGSSKRRGHTLAAHNLRLELRRAFPGVKFSVTSSSFSGGNSVSVRWEDGPTPKAVEAITQRYEAGTFNGWDDSYTYRSGVGRVWGEVFGSTRWAHPDNRDYSDAAYSWAVSQLLAQWASPEDAIPEWTPAQVRRGLFNSVRIHRAGEYLGTLIHRLLYQTDAAAWASPAEPGVMPAAWALDEAGTKVAVRFQKTPPAAVREVLKAEGFRWNRAALTWNTRRTSEAEAVARQICDFLAFCEV